MIQSNVVIMASLIGFGTPVPPSSSWSSALSAPVNKVVTPTEPPKERKPVVKNKKQKIVKKKKAKTSSKARKNNLPWS